MMGKLHIDLTFQNCYLLNGVEVRLRLIRSKDLFCLHGNANQAQNKVSLKEVTLFVRKVKPNPAVQLAHVKASQHTTAKYPLRVWQSRVLPCRQSKHHQRKPVFGSATYSIGSRYGGQQRIQRCHNQISFSFQAQQHQFHDDLPGWSSNPFQTASTGFYQRSFYSKLSSFIYANGSTLSRHRKRYFARTVEGRLCLVRFRSHASDGFERGRFRIHKARQHTNRNSFCYCYCTHSYCDCVCRKRQPTGNRSRQKRCF